MPSHFRPLIALAAALAVASQAQALTLGSVADNGNVVDTSFVLPGQIGLDLAFLSQAPVSLAFTLDDGDAGDAVSFNAIVREISGAAMSQVRLVLSGGALFSVPAGSTFTVAGDALVPNLTAGNTQVDLLASPPTNEIYLGDPFGLFGAQNWQIGFGQLASGDSFTLTVTQVPEPQTWALLLGGLGGLLVMARRRLPG